MQTMTAHASHVRPAAANQESARSGMTLFEVLVCVSILTVLLNVCMSIFDSGTRLSALAIEGLERMDGALEVQQGFTETVRGAVGVVDGIGSHRTGSDTLVLSMPFEGAERRYAILGRLSEGDGLCRMDVCVRGNDMEATSFIRYPLPLASYSFNVNAGQASQARLISFEFTIKRAPGEHGRPLRHTLSAALRGFDGGRP